MKEKEKIKAAINRPLDKKVRQEIETAATHRSDTLNVDSKRSNNLSNGVVP